MRLARLECFLTNRTWCGVALLSLTFVLGAGVPRASAQFDTATVVGTVKDASGSSVADAKVTLTNTETGVSVVRTSNSEGNFEFVSVRPGLYLISAERQGFSLALMDNLRVEVGARVRADLKLEVGALTEEVKVTADARLVQTDDSQRSQVLSTVQIQQLPLNGRSYSALWLLVMTFTSATASGGGCMI